MLNISLSYRFTRNSDAAAAADADAEGIRSVATDALSAITVWGALDGERCFRLLFADSEAVLVAEITFPRSAMEPAMRDLEELCKEHELSREVVAST